MAERLSDQLKRLIDEYAAAMARPGSGMWGTAKAGAIEIAYDDLRLYLVNRANNFAALIDAAEQEICTCATTDVWADRFNPAARHFYECPTQRMPELCSALAAFGAGQETER